MFVEKNPRFIDGSARCYQWLLAVYPVDHRREYGAWMVQLFRDQCREAYQCEGFWGLVKNWLRVLPDLGKSACLEHLAKIKRRLPMVQQPLFYRRQRRLMGAVFLLVFCGTAFLTFWQPQYYSSTARISVQKDAPEPSGPRDSWGATVAYDPYFIQTEFEKLRSKEVLYRVIQDLDLAKRWAEKSQVEGSFAPQEALAILNKCLDIRQHPNTSLIEIRVFDEDQNEAADIANKIAEIYRDLRLEHAQVAALQGVESLERALAEQDANLKTSQTKVEKMRADLNISDATAEANFAGTGGAELLRALEAKAREADIAFRNAERFASQITSVSRGELRKVLPTACPDTLLTELLSRYNQSEVELLALRRDRSDSHPDVVRAQTVRDKLNEQVEDRIEGILAGLKLKLQALAGERQMLTEAWQESVKKDADNSQKYSAYSLVKRDLETQKQLRQAIQLKLLQELVDAGLTKTVPVQLVDRAEPGLRPVRPNRIWNLAAGLLVGLLASLGVGVAWLLKGLGARSAPRGVA